MHRQLRLEFPSAGDLGEAGNRCDYTQVLFYLSHMHSSFKGIFVFLLPTGSLCHCWCPTDVEWVKLQSEPMHAQLLQSCPTLCDPMDHSLPNCSVHGILQARLLEWVAISSSREPSWPKDRTYVSCSSCTAGGFFTTEPAGKPQILNLNL